MKKISSWQTNFLRNIIPIIILLDIISVIICLAFFDVSKRLLLNILSPTIIFGYAWISSFRKLKTVFLGETFFSIDNKKIPFDKIISLKRSYLTNIVQISYTVNDKKEVFIFRPIFSIFLNLNYFKKIEKLIQKNQK